MQAANKILNRAALTASLIWGSLFVIDNGAARVDELDANSNEILTDCLCKNFWGEFQCSN